MRIGFSTGGTVARVNVKEGDKVKTGDVIAQLDTNDLELQVKSAQDAVDLATRSLAQAKTPASAEEITAAQAAYDSALAALARVQQGPTAEDIKILKSNLAKAQAALDNGGRGPRPHALHAAPADAAFRLG